jgi:hypothetical protein
MAQTKNKIIEDERERERKRKARAKARKEALARQPRKGKSVAEFCHSWGVSRSTYEDWQRHEPPIGPAILQPGGKGSRIIITEQAEAEWASKRTAQPAVAVPAE